MSYMYSRSGQVERGDWGQQQGAHGEPMRGPSAGPVDRYQIGGRGVGQGAGAIDQHALALALESSLRTFSPSPVQPPSFEAQHSHTPSSSRPTKVNPDVTAMWTHAITGQHIHFVLTTINADRAPVHLRVEETTVASLGLTGLSSRFQGFGQVGAFGVGVGKQPQF
jgi:hypothetical protein